MESALISHNTNFWKLSALHMLKIDFLESATFCEDCILTGNAPGYFWARRFLQL